RRIIVPVSVPAFSPSSSLAAPHRRGAKRNSPAPSLSRMNCTVPLHKSHSPSQNTSGRSSRSGLAVRFPLPRGGLAGACGRMGARPGPNSTQLLNMTPLWTEQLYSSDRAAEGRRKEVHHPKFVFPAAGVRGTYSLQQPHEPKGTVALLLVTGTVS